MSKTKAPRWKKMQDADSREVERALRVEFPDTDAYRYNSASIRVRVTDDRFEGKGHVARVRMVERILDHLPEDLQSQIMNLVTVTPSERTTVTRQSMANLEFDDPSPSDL